MTVHTNIFESVSELQDFLRTAPLASQFTDGGRTASTSRANTDMSGKGKYAMRWDGGLTLQEAADQAAVGWAEARTDADTIATQVSADVLKDTNTPRPSFELGFAGQVVDMGRFTSGHPMHMVDFAMVANDAAERVCVIVVGVCVSASIQPETMVKRGAAIVALMDVVASTGRSVEVWVEATTVTNGTTLQAAVRVKAAHQALDLDVLMYAIAHPAMFRRNLFGTWERSKGGDKLDYGYGRATKVQLGAQLGATVVLDSENNNSPREVTNPVGWVTDMLDKIAANERVGV